MSNVVEKYYSAKELSLLVGFHPQWWREKIKAEPRLVADGVVISECREISGELLAPASWVNGILARNPVSYDPGIKARNLSELRRKLAALPPLPPAA